MTANEAITKADTLRPDQIPKATKTEWIRQLEQTVYNEIYKTHDTTDIEFTDMDSETFADDKLFVPAPYDEIYMQYLCVKIDYYNAEYERYNNDTATFTALYNSYATHYNREHMPVTAELKY